MSGFSELVRGFCIIAVSGGLMLIISPDGKLKKYVKFVLSLCMVCALLSAFFTFSEKAGNIFSEIELEVQDTAAKTQEEIYAEVVNRSKKNMEAEVRSLLAAHLGVGQEDIYVVVQIDTAEPSAVEITKITVFLADTAHSDVAREYLADMFIGAVPIDIMKKGE